MKKLFFASLLAVAGPALADNGLDIYLGTSLWYAHAEGGIALPDIDYTLELDEKQIETNYNSVISLAFEHSLAYLPNLRISQNNIRHNGTGNIVYTGSTFPIAGQLDLGHTDLALYYRVAEGVGFVDVGITARAFNGELFINLLPSGPSSSSDLSTVLGLVYLHGGIRLPLTGLSLGLMFEGGKNSSDQSTDASFYLQYETADGLGANYGYRYQNIDMQAEGVIGSSTIDLTANFDVYGPFASIYFHF